METVDDEVLGDIARKIRSQNDGLNPKSKGLRTSTILEWLQTRGIADDTDDAKFILNQLVQAGFLASFHSNEGTKSVRYTWGPRNPEPESDEESNVSESLESSDGPADRLPSKTSHRSGDSSDQGGSESSTNQDSSEVSDSKISEKIGELIAELQVLAPEVRTKLNVSAFSSLIASLLEDSRILGANSASSPSLNVTSTKKSAATLNKEIDANVAAWLVQLERIKSVKDDYQKKKALEALKVMKQELKKPLGSDAILLFDDEQLVWTISRVSLTGVPGSYSGRVVLTNFRIFVLDETDTVINSASLATIWSVTKVQKPKEKGGKSSKDDKSEKERGLRKVEIILKDQRIWYLHFKKDASDELLERLEAHKKGMPVNLWCWNFKSGVPAIPPLYDFKREFERFGVPSAQWRVTDVNSEYKFCDTYPALLAVPSSVDDELLKSASSFRSRSRIPALAYRHPNGSVITRSSQPAVGIGMKRSKDDERLLAEIAATNPQNPVLPIFDARPKVNAVANTAMGFGWEMVSHYPGCTLTFCGIENIHVMRNSYFKVRDMIQSKDETPNWFGSLHESGWLGHQQLILHWSIKLADLLHLQNTSCLVHCTDGWDRTTQFVSLCQLLLDPFYRTLSGFFILIEKDWLSFGHRFAMRHATDGKESSDRAPIFHQFIECVWQLLQMFPTHFEFNEQVLLDILDEVYACRFGTFVFDCEKERVEADLATKTSSLWPYMLSRSKIYSNPFFDAATAKPFIPSPQQVSRRLKFWDAYYLRFSDPLAVSQNMWALSTKQPSASGTSSSPGTPRLNRTKTVSTVTVTRAQHSPSISTSLKPTKTRRRSKSTAQAPLESESSETPDKKKKDKKEKQKDEESSQDQDSSRKKKDK